jgi:hypothetical protein
MLQSRPITPNDYDQLCEWWASWGWQYPIPQDMLSNKGVMIFDGGVNICAGFLYLMNNAPIAWFTFPVSNKVIRGDLRKEAMKLLVETVNKQAEESGAKYIYSSLKNESMILTQKENGFVETDKGFTELLKII